MKTSINANTIFNAVATLRFPTLYPGLGNALVSGSQNSRTGCRGKTARVDRKAGNESIFERLLHVIDAPSRHCVECLEDIPKEAERCPHCRTLQNTESLRMRERDAGWL